MGRAVRGARPDVVKIVWALVLALSVWANPARAEIKEYQIRRMLMLKTECGVSGLDISKIADAAAAGTRPEARYTDRFLATCENVAHYPDGVEIICPDTEDEMDCRLLTIKRVFPHLKLFQP